MSLASLCHGRVNYGLHSEINHNHCHIFYKSSSIFLLSFPLSLKSLYIIRTIFILFLSHHMLYASFIITVNAEYKSSSFYLFPFHPSAMSLNIRLSIHRSYILFVMIHTLCYHHFHCYHYKLCQ